MELHFRTIHFPFHSIFAFQNLKLCQSNTPLLRKNKRKKRYKTDEHLQIGELESDLETTQKKIHFYRYSMDIINDLAKELTGIVQSVYEVGIMSINAACNLLEYARSTFFEVRQNDISRKEKNEIIEEFVLEKVKEIWKE